MLTGKKKPTHEMIQKVYTSFRTLKYQDPSLSHVRLMDASIHALLDLNFIARHHRHCGPFFGKSQSASCTNAQCAACNDADFVGQAHAFTFLNLTL
jgi:hypothetical protein